MTAPKALPQTKIIVGICSARAMHERREAVRHTWMAENQPGIRCLFFVGGEEPLQDEPDTIALACADSDEELPGKVVEFLKYCCDQWDFEWLFKCDDDTYLALERLPALLKMGAEFVGCEYENGDRLPGCRAGYLLSRRVVELLANERNLPRAGEEDSLIGEAATRLGARCERTKQLCQDNDRFPAPDNDTITSHWSNPVRLHAIHANLHECPEIVEVTHSRWNDRLSLYPGGLFSRHTTGCCGLWHPSKSGLILLEWFDWDTEILVPEPVPALGALTSAGTKYRCLPPPAPRPILQPGANPISLAPLEESQKSEKVIAVFITTSSYGLPHLDRFLELNPGLTTHVVCTPIAPPGKERERAWRNCDSPIHHWWLDQGQQLSFKYAVFIEWDVVFDDTVDAVFPEDHDFYCRDLKKPGMPWDWFSQVDLLPPTLKPFATGTPPMAVLRISRRCLDAVFSHPEAEEAYRRDIQAELRFATLASACGFEPVPCPGTLSNVTCWSASMGFGPAVWHSVKHRQESFLRLPEEFMELIAAQARSSAPP